jgi:hypothetical protein
VGKLVEGWDLDSIINFHSGLPYQISLNFDNLNDGRRSGPETPHLVGNPNSGPKTPLQWFNPQAFAIPAQYTFGNVGRNTLIGPGLKNFDLALHKTIRIRESHALEFRTEWFNAFNNVDFNNPSGTQMGVQGPKTSGFGAITSTSHAERQIQFALKYIF